jgi:hypothetical protein
VEAGRNLKSMIGKNPLDFIQQTVNRNIDMKDSVRSQKEMRFMADKA